MVRLNKKVTPRSRAPALPRGGQLDVCYCASPIMYPHPIISKVALARASVNIGVPLSSEPKRTLSSDRRNRWFGNFREVSRPETGRRVRNGRLRRVSDNHPRNRSGSEPLMIAASPGVAGVISAAGCRVEPFRVRLGNGKEGTHHEHCDRRPRKHRLASGKESHQQWRKGHRRGQDLGRKRRSLRASLEAMPRPCQSRNGRRAQESIMEGKIAMAPASRNFGLGRQIHGAFENYAFRCIRRVPNL
jgi:hypothetical protein